MLIRHCFSHENKDYLECSTHDKKLFECVCCNNAEIDNCKSRIYKHAFNIHKNHSKIETEYDYDDDYDDEIENPPHEYIYYDDVNITDLHHLYEECKERQYLPLLCSVEKNDTSTTICDCESDEKNQAIDSTHFNSSSIWNDHACDITTEYHKMAKLQQHIQNLSYLCIFLLVFFLVFLIIGYVIKRMKKLAEQRALNDEIALIPR